MRHSPPRGRHREREHDRGPGPFGPFGPFGFGGPGPGNPFARFGFGRGPKARRGDVRAAALLLLAEDARNGYQLMQEIESRTSGLWRPSPGSIYPVLQQLEDEGLVRPDGPEGRRVFQLTEAGRSYVKEHAEELGSPWDVVNESAGESARDFHMLFAQLVVAIRQVAHVGSVTQVREAEAVLVDARRRLYRILAEESPEDEPGGAHREER